MKFSWTQPICIVCYEKAEPGRIPTMMKEAGIEKCCICGLPTRNGIYYRIDPRTVAFPTRVK